MRGFLYCQAYIVDETILQVFQCVFTCDTQLYVFLCTCVYFRVWHTIFVYARMKRRKVSLCRSNQFSHTFSNTTHNLINLVYMYIFKCDTQLLCMCVLQGAMGLFAVACNSTHSSKISIQFQIRHTLVRISCICVYFQIRRTIFVYVRIKGCNVSLCCVLQFYAFFKSFDTISNTTHSCM